MNTIKTLFLLCIFAVSAMGQATPATPLLLDISAGATRSFGLPSGKVLTFKSGSQLAIDDGTTFNIGSTAAASLRSAIGDFSSTRVFTNDANRLAATPNFTGQLALQTDGPLPILLMSNSTTTGDWGASFAITSIQASGEVQAASGLRGYAAGSYSGVLGQSNVAGISGGWMESTNTGTALNLNSTSSGLLLEGRNSGSVNVSLSKTGVFLAGDGAVGGPSLGFINDPDSGFYSSGANTIGIAAGGASVGTFSASGLALSTALGVVSGGTGATTATGARSALGVQFYYAQYSHHAADGTSGGTSTAGSWQTRPLTREDHDAGNIGSLSSNAVTLPAGTYRVRAAFAFGQPAHLVTRLYDQTNSAELVRGNAQNIVAGSAGVSELVGRFTLAGSAAVRVEYWAQTGTATTGLGVATSQAAGEEVFGSVTFEQEP